MKRKLLTFLLLFCFIESKTMVNPQPGENIWHLTAAIGTSLDSLSTTVNTDLPAISNAITACCSCNPIPLTLSSGGTTISTPGVYCLTSDLTLGASNSICINSNNVVLDLNSKTITGGGILIGQNSSTSVSNVAIRNGTLANSTNTGIATNTNTVDGYSALTIENIVITTDNEAPSPAPTNVGLAFQGFTRDCVIRNVRIDFCTTGFNLVGSIGSENCLIENCVAADCSGDGFFVSSTCNTTTIRNCVSSLNDSNGFNVQDSSATLDSCIASSNFFGFNITASATLINCSAINSRGGTPPNSPGYGFSLSTEEFVQATLINCSAIDGENGYGFSGGGVFINCVAQNNYTGGFSLASQSTLNSCQATSNGSDGFICNSVTNCQLAQCQSANNHGNGFNFSLATSGSVSSNTLTGCIATNNFLDGFNFTSGNAVNNTLNQCVAANNLQSGFDFTGAGAFNTISNCTAANNSSFSSSFFGFKSTSASQTAANFYLNTSSKNGTTTPSTQNYSSSPIGADSAPVSAVTGTRSYGDNLSAV